jgi:hypothetical protein
MKARLVALVVMGGLLGASALACSSADSSGDEPTQEDKPSSGRKHGSSSSSGSSDDTGDTSETTDTSSDPSGTSPPGETPPSSSSSGGSSTDGGAEGGTTPPPATGPQCMALASCAGAKALPSIAGDGSEQTSLSGAGSQWLTLHVREDSFSDTPVGFTAELYSPENATYEMYIYGTDCKTSLSTVAQLSDGAEGSASWDDSNFLDDAKDVLIEIRYTGGACTTADTWKLDILGGIF